MDGKSTTPVPANLPALQGGELAINPHKSTAELFIYIGSGVIPAAGG